jgi:hypothetical protein
MEIRSSGDILSRGIEIYTKLPCERDLQVASSLLAL